MRYSIFSLLALQLFSSTAYAACPSVIKGLSGEGGARLIIDYADFIGVATTAELPQSVASDAYMITPFLQLKGNLHSGAVVTPYSKGPGYISPGSIPPKEWSLGLGFYALRENADKTLYQNECITQILSGPHRQSVMQALLLREIPK